jgi:hypothetical protein
MLCKNKSLSHTHTKRNNALWTSVFPPPQLWCFPKLHEVSQVGSIQPLKLWATYTRHHYRLNFRYYGKPNPGPLLCWVSVGRVPELPCSKDITKHKNQVNSFLVTLGITVKNDTAHCEKWMPTQFLHSVTIPPNTLRKISEVFVTADKTLGHIMLGNVTDLDP